MSDAAAAQFPLRVPQGFVARMRHGDPHDPLLRQVLPLDDEMRPMPGLQPRRGRRRRRQGRQRRDPEVPRPRPADRHRQLRGALPLLLPPALSRMPRKPRPRPAGATRSKLIRADAHHRRGDPVRRRPVVAVDRQAGRADRRARRRRAPQAPARPHPPAGGIARARRRAPCSAGCARCRGRPPWSCTPTMPTSSMPTSTRALARLARRPARRCSTRRSCCAASTIRSRRWPS